VVKKIARKTKPVINNGVPVGLVTNNSKKINIYCPASFWRKNKRKNLYFFAMKNLQQQLSL
jgi:hypothetical protein